MITVRTCSHSVCTHVCTYMCVFCRASYYIVIVYTLKQGALRIFMAFSTCALCGFRWKYFFFQNTTSAFKLLMNKRDSDGFLSSRLVCTSSAFLPLCSCLLSTVHVEISLGENFRLFHQCIPLAKIFPQIFFRSENFDIILLVQSWVHTHMRIAIRGLYPQRPGR